MNEQLALPPSGCSLTPSSLTPSGLTPNTRSEAEFALLFNSSTQTDSAAPDPGLLPKMSARDNDSRSDTPEALHAYRRPDILRTSSTNYQNALKEAHQVSGFSDMSTDTDVPVNVTGAGTVASPTSSTTPFPPPGQGVVPLNYGNSTGQPETAKKSRSRGLSLGARAKQQSWSEQDFKRIYNADLLSDQPKDAGYASGDDGKTHA